MNPHFIFNSLNAIQHYIISNDKVQALQYISIFGKLMRHYLVHMNTHVIDLRTETSMMGLYLKLQKLRYEGRFDYRYIVENTSRRDINIPTMILPTLVECTLEEAVKSLATSNKLELTIVTLANSIEISAKYSSNGSVSDVATNDRYQNLEDHLEALNKANHDRMKYKIKFDQLGETSIITAKLAIPILD